MSILKPKYPKMFLLKPVMYMYVRWVLYTMDVNDLFRSIKNSIDKRQK